jgi:DNA-binding GntR family transcriptional regulator
MDPVEIPAERKAGKTASGLSASVIATLKERIVTWHYPPEYRLTEEDLCREFGVSRSPVREALRVLATNGFVRHMPNRGYAVKQVNIRELEELYELRMALELHIVDALATRGAEEAELDRLRREWLEVGRGPERAGEELAGLDSRFHESLAALLGNDTILSHLRAINERLFVFRMIDFDKDRRVDSTCDQHLEVLERIGARDPEGARRAMRQNIEEARTIVSSALKEALARAYSL